MFYKTTVSGTVYLVLTREYMNQEYIDQWNRTGHTEIEQNSFENLEQYRRKGGISNH